MLNFLLNTISKFAFESLMDSSEISKLGAVKSPTRNLTGLARKTRDRCVDYLNSLTQLKVYNRDGQLILNHLLSLHKKNDAFPDINLSYNDFEDFQISFMNLKEILNKIENQVNILKKVTNLLQEQLKMEQNLKMIQYFDVSTQDLCFLFQKITYNQEKNYEAKKLVLSKLFTQKSSQDLFYLFSLWVNDPFDGQALQRNIEFVKDNVVDFNKS